MLLGFLGRHQAAVGAQQRDFSCHADVAQPAAQAPHVAADDRAHGGIRNRRQGSFVFLHLRQNHVAEGDRNVRHELGSDGADAGFVRAVHVGVDERNGNRFHALRRQLLQGGADFSFVDRAELIALRCHPAAYFDGVLECRKRCGFWPDDPAGEPARHEAAGNLHDLPVALGDDQADARALAFQHRVGGNRCAMQEHFNVRRRYAGMCTDGLYADEYAFGTVRRCRGRLVAPEFAAGCVEQKQVGECAADIYT